MERRGIAVEVLGVPNILTADRINDKLTIHFLRARHGGGEVQRVLYPSYRPGQALIIFEEPEVAARVLKHGSHVLEVHNRRFPLTVKPVDMPEVDIPVEATLDISIFPDKTEVMQLLDLHGLEVTGKSREQVRVKGTFMMLTAVKARLEKLLNSQTHSQNTASSPAPILNGHNHSSGSINKTRTDGNLMYAAGSRGTAISSTLPKYALPSHPTNSSPLAHQADQSSIQTHQHYPQARSEAFVIDEDVLRYAQSFKTKDIALILNSHRVKIDVSTGDLGLSNVTLSGSSANAAKGKLQNLLDDLTKTLCTQQICLSDHDTVTQVNLNKKVKVYKDIYPSVLISQTRDTIHVVGPSRDTYEVTQMLLGKPTTQLPPVRHGRTLDRGSKGRSSSLSRVKLNEDRVRARDVRSNETPDTQGYYSSKYQDDRRAAVAEPDPPLESSAVRRARRSHSESREKVREERPTADHSHNNANQGDTSRTQKVKAFLKNISPKDLRIKKISWK